jgi:colanic acid/amylovoran biosynthesis protein
MAEAIGTRLSLCGRRNDRRSLKEFVGSLLNAHAVVVCGAGGFDDHCREWNLAILETLRLAIQRRVPTALFGQGIGPLTDPDVLAKARQVLPDVDLITCRGTRGGAALLESLGVPRHRNLVTGDEAIELGFAARVHTPGRCLGVNLRVSQNAGTRADDLGKVKPILQGFATRQNVTMVPVPIACHPWARDHESIKELMSGGDGGVNLDSPSKIIEQVGQCRVVVSGAYHAAVFALSQGIPVVALVRSPYFLHKMRGLQDQFGCGIETVILDQPDFTDKFRNAIERAWQTADAVRASLQRAAMLQIAASQQAYEEFKRIVDDRYGQN